MENRMSRNKYPEETRELILNVSTKLFFEKGYDETSLQDIIDGLGGMTKGAIYHHFRSKEDILIAVVERMSEENSRAMAKIRDDEALNGRQKIEKMFTDSLINPKQREMFTVTPDLLDNPRLLAYDMKMVAYTVVPDYVLPVIKQAVEDGSIQTKYPEELADVIMFLADIWMNPLIFRMTDQQLANRILLINEMLKPFCIELFNEELITLMQTYRKVTESGSLDSR